MASCVFPGSFDPVTRGHVDLISRASCIFDHVTVTVMVNVNKSGTIPVGKRIDLLKKACLPFRNVSIDSWDGLLSEYMAMKHEKIVVRGLRNAAEYDHEIQSASANKMLNDQFETVFLVSDPAFTGVSSSAVREIASFGGNIQAFVPDGLTEEIRELLSKKNYNRQ